MKKLFRSIFVFLLVALVAIVAIVGTAGYRRYKDLTAQTPVQAMVAQIEASPDFVPYEQLPATLINATVSVEDRRFFEHGGVDYIGIVRALLSQVFPDVFVQSGGSTITQQTVKNMYGMFTSSVTRKVAEIFLAKDLER
ncbi:biosynthetic peptidoglycan transglycosylase, partial [uncultured Dubosiella sp.]